MSDRGNPFLLPGARSGSQPEPARDAALPATAPVEPMPLEPPREEAAVEPSAESGTRRLPRSGGPAATTPRSGPRAPVTPAASGAPAPGVRWRLVLPGGAEVPLDTAVLLGRDPVAPEGARGARPIAVRDPQKTVSKTHVLLTPDPSGVRVRDLNSTNGTTLVLPGGSAPVPAGGEVLVGHALDIELGRFLVRIEP